MTANVNITKVLFKRGNTAQNAAYTGINGEITVDTQAKTLRVHDGVTTGGNIVTAGAMASYIPTDPTITSIQANVVAANAAISAIAGIDTSLLANAATQQTQINLINSNIAAYLTSGITTANLTINGNVVQNSAYYETYANVTNSGGNLICNFVDGATFYATLDANVTVNFTNVVATAGRATGATIIVDQGATPYSVANIQINGGSVQTIKYAGGTGVNTGTASNTDIMSFSLISLDGTDWRILGQIANYA